MWIAYIHPFLHQACYTFSKSQGKRCIQGQTFWLKNNFSRQGSEGNSCSLPWELTLTLLIYGPLSGLKVNQRVSQIRLWILHMNVRGAVRQYLEKLFYTDEGYSRAATMGTSTDFAPPRQKRIQGRGNFFLFCIQQVLSHEDSMSAVKVFYFILLSRFYIDVA